jgi:hypothetical protein
MKPRFMAMMALALTVSGCATRDDPVLFTGSIKPDAPTLEADVSPEYAAAYLPQVAGRVEAVRQSSSPGRIFQTVLYPNQGYGGGENHLTVSIAPPSADSSYFQAPTRRQITNEMRSVLPGVAMRITSVAGQNLHGPFGYAIGAGGNSGTCVFAWQTAKQIGRTPGTGLGRLAPSRYAAKVRLRYCHPTMTESSLVSLMAGLRIREVSPTTIEMLRFAEGTGVTARSIQIVRQPALVDNGPVASKATQAVKAKPKPKQPAVVAAPLPNTPRVLKPGELAAYKKAQKALPATPDLAAAKTTPMLPASTTPPVIPVSVKTPAIPLPGDLER